MLYFHTVPGLDNLHLIRTFRALGIQLWLFELWGVYDEDLRCNLNVINRHTNIQASKVILNEPSFVVTL